MSTHKSIMVIEDDMDLQTLIKVSLVQRGYLVFTAENGEEALEKLIILNDAHKPCLVLCDLAMPVMNGWEFVKIVSKHNRLATIPVVVHTSEDRGPDGVRLLKKSAGMGVIMEIVAEYCGKPGDKSDE